MKSIPKFIPKLKMAITETAIIAPEILNQSLVLLMNPNGALAFFSFDPNKLMFCENFLLTNAYRIVLVITIAVNIETKTPAARLNANPLITELPK